MATKMVRRSDRSAQCVPWRCGAVMKETIESCCGDVCRFTRLGLPVARVMLCGREITKEDSDAAKVAFLRHGPKNKADIDWREPQGDE